MSQKKEILVYADWYMYDSPQLVGVLTFSALRGKFVYSFEYNKEWIKSGIAIDPELPLFSGLHYAASNDNFGIFKDSSPDRWGQLLMKRREILLAKMKKRDPRPLFGIDFMLGVHDSHRMGALRFKEDENEDFLSNEKALAAPPWTSLRELEYAAGQYEKNADQLDETSLKWIDQLIAPGSSLGGARPKADIIDTKGNQWIAKFPSRRDDYDVGLWEMIVHELAVLAGIYVPNASIKKLGTSYHTYLSQRFDRTEDRRRIHYASAMTLLQHNDGDDSGMGASYLELVDFIKSECADAKSNLEELFRRVLFSVCVSNTDDHLRNHGFIYTETGWTLSPAFDINANETGTGLKLNIDEHDNSLDVDLVMKTAHYYLLSAQRADEIKTEVVNAVSNWREVAKKHKVPPSEIERKARAFIRL
ncbi:type II toxin-antitoxin system HipA family toxin [Parabacteroides sp. PF5-6]|uniref:type II toxin-antitoxin system HipA family toxin n=1 Tax=Parabacteroides sp. PF5-6 TaxID=1742403 RepID=UPI002406BB5C|nr:type II toxin-antitoxin system HipA family toxin [Parabacteroides sp. PF5-6]MDF9830670.1 serine/threonine-protein kinase HipA [Parabacteroides sp. PF5-6]